MHNMRHRQMSEVHWLLVWDNPNDRRASCLTREADSTCQSVIWDFSQYLTLLLMSVKQTNNPGGRLTRVYDAQERAAIDPFKKDYLAATSPAGRKIVAQLHILPALFNYWASKGQVIDDNEKRIRTDVSCRVCLHFGLPLNLGWLF